jgi:acyl-CoA thioesterase-2
MELSFHREEKGFEHDIDLDIDVPDPDQLLSLSELTRKFADRLPQGAIPYFDREIVEMKPVNPEDFLMRKSDTTRGLYWIRSVSKLPDDPLTQMAALAYLSDYFLISTIVLKHTISMLSGEVMMASLDHAMWFHRPTRADEWVLIDTLSPFAGGARGFTRGQIFDRNRKLISSVAQEGLVRPIESGKG